MVIIDDKFIDKTIPDEFLKIIKYFVRDITNTFPEYKIFIDSSNHMFGTIFNNNYVYLPSWLGNIQLISGTLLFYSFQPTTKLIEL